MSSSSSTASRRMLTPHSTHANSITNAHVLPKNPPKMVKGLMQPTQLLIQNLIEHADLYHGQREVVSRLPELPTGPLHRTNYSQIHKRSKQLANALLHELGVSQGTVVGTLAFNTFRHFEAYYAVSGIGAILHTINPRLFLEQIDYIVNHGEDDILMVDIGCVPVLLQLLDRKVILTRKFIIMTDEKHMPRDPRLHAAGLHIFCYETLISKHSAHLKWPEFDENTASSLCYTSGTTGNPKGVLYSHRSTLLHSFCIASADALAICSNDSILAIVPMFHANSWGVPYAACMTGAKLILPGAALDGKSVCDLITEEQVTFVFGVPTVFLGMFQYMDSANIKSLGVLNRVTIGGAAPPRSMIRRFMIDLGVPVLQGWGMTEMSPLGTTTGQWLPQHQNLTAEQKVDVACKAGRVMYGVSMKVVDEDGKELPRDGKTSGDLVVAGPWITSGYHRLGESNLEADGYFKTGDVATLDRDGYMAITDRSKDVIKSGGEWISSIDLENEAMNHPAVGEAAVIGVSHPKWTERPLLVVVVKKGQKLTEAEMLEFLSTRVAKWWVPEAVEFVKEIPHTATGKIKKIDLRKQFQNYQWRNQSTNSPTIQSKL